MRPLTTCIFAGQAAFNGSAGVRVRPGLFVVVAVTTAVKGLDQSGGPEGSRRLGGRPPGCPRAGVARRMRRPVSQCGGREGRGSVDAGRPGLHSPPEANTSHPPMIGSATGLDGRTPGRPSRTTGRRTVVGDTLLHVAGKVSIAHNLLRLAGACGISDVDLLAPPAPHAGGGRVPDNGSVGGARPAQAAGHRLEPRRENLDAQPRPVSQWRERARVRWLVSRAGRG